MTETPTPATGGDARELSDEQLLDAFAKDSYGLTNVRTSYGTELLRRLRRATPAADPGMVKPYTSAELMRMAIAGVPRSPDRALATYAEPSYWKTVIAHQRNWWAWDGPVIVGYELAQSAIAAADPAPEEGEGKR
jgi:hypothetical protein